MSTKKPDPSAIDEALIRNLIGGHTPALQPRETPAHSQSETTSELPPMPTTEYAQLFLQPKKIRVRRTCVMEAATMQKIELICWRLGCGLSLAALVDNIVSHHVETYRDQINAMIDNVSDHV